jgi:predicted metal-binding membrane protein
VIDTAHEPLLHLSPAESRLGDAVARPRAIAAFCVVALTALGWAYLALLTIGARDPSSAFDALCRAMVDASSGFTGVLLIAPMWGAMTLAMMLPSAAPMILTYAEIADTAARQGERIVSPFVLAGGYLSVWFAVAVAATLAQVVFTRLALLDTGMAPVSRLFSGAIFLIAGLYQFSALKHACLTQCQRPFPFFFANWATTTRGVYKLGLRQGLYCLGCCWAMMAVMFAVGTMNVIWMAGLGIVMTVEKMGAGRKLTYAVGAALIVAGLAFIATAFAAHWPARMS